MNITELLKLRGLDTNVKIKLVHHQDDRYDLWDLYRTGHFETYQSYQSKPIFRCEYVVAFMGLDGSRAQFIGVYRVCSSKPAREALLPPDYPYPNFAKADDFYYDLQPVAGFEDFKDRVIIDWGSSPRAWPQWLNKRQKDVVEVLPKGYVKAFPGYLEAILKFDELVAIIKNPVANREWHRMLSAVAGVYLIVDNKTGKQYIGAAYGNDGIWGRWANYAKSFHGGKDMLKALVGDDSSYARNFTFTILHILLKTATKDEVVAWEVHYKKKLGTRAFGLNLN